MIAMINQCLKKLNYQNVCLISSNNWPPLQEIVVTGLENTGEAKGKELAKELAQKWIKNVYVSYVQSGEKMFEKYDVVQVKIKSNIYNLCQVNIILLTENSIYL